MTQEAKVILGIAVATIAILVGAVVFMSKPAGTPENVERVTDTAQLVGDGKRAVKAEGSKVTIVEFADFQCPACASAHPIVKQVLADYKGKVTYVYRHFPLPMHQNATLAAIAAEEAGEQGKFFEYHDLLFDNQKEWETSTKPEEIFLSYAQRLELDTTKFQQALDQKAHAERIQTDQDAGIALGVNSTPTFFVNGEKIPGVVQYDEFKQKIDAELQ
jgi:protein-disulfide isomerase